MWWFIGILIYYIVGLIITFNACGKFPKNSVDNYHPEFVIIYMVGPWIWPYILIKKLN